MRLGHGRDKHQIYFQVSSHSQVVRKVKVHDPGATGMPEGIPKNRPSGVEAGLGRRVAVVDWLMLHFDGPPRRLMAPTPDKGIIAESA